MPTTNTTPHTFSHIQRTDTNEYTTKFSEVYMWTVSSTYPVRTHSN